MNLICALFVSGLLALLFSPASPVTAKAETVDLQLIVAHVEEALQRDKVPGAALAVILEGEVALVRTFGLDGNGIPITKETPFRLGSMSKAFTAFVAMRLVEAGTIDLDQDAGSFLPELEVNSALDWKKITLRQLLNHTSGLPVRTPGPEAGASLLEYVEALGAVEPVSEPGKHHLYSSANYLVAARMLEVASGTAFDTLLKVNVLDPLGFSQAKTTPPGHQYWFLWTRVAHFGADPGRLATASLTANIQDMVNFLKFQLGNGSWLGQELLPPEGLSEMHAGSAEGEGFKYGFGWRESTMAGQRVVHHGGILPDYRGKMAFLPDQQAAIVLLTNASSLLPFGLQPTSHQLANDIAWYLAGGPLGIPRLGFGNWLAIYWIGLGLLLLAQTATLVRVIAGRDKAKRPGRAAAIDCMIAAVVVVGVPYGIGLTWPQILLQTPDFALWLAVMVFLDLVAAGIRLARLRK